MSPSIFRPLFRRASLLAALLALAAGLGPTPALAQYRNPPYPYGGGYLRYEADVRVEVKPNTASVYVDGYLAGRVDEFDGVFQRLHLEAGQHEIVVYLAGHKSLRERLYFSPNQTRKITGTLEPLAAGERDEGPPVPQPRAQPAADGRNGPDGPDGQRPPFGRGVPPDGRADPAARPGQGVATLSIRVQPADADVMVDGQPWHASQGDERLVIQLSEGRHLVEVSKAGYRRFTTEVDLRAGATVPVNVSLTSDRQP